MTAHDLGQLTLPQVLCSFFIGIQQSYEVDVLGIEAIDDVPEVALTADVVSPPARGQLVQEAQGQHAPNVVSTHAVLTEGVKNGIAVT